MAEPGPHRSDHPLRCKDNEEQARQRLRAFWAGEAIDRPALHVTAKRPDYQEPAWDGPTLDHRGRDHSPAWHAFDARRYLDGREFLAEAMPYVYPHIGNNLIVLSALAGAEHTYSAGTAWIDEIPDLWERPLPRFDPAHPMARLGDSAMEAQAEAIGEDGIVGPPSLLDPLTTISDMIRPAALCEALIDRPDDVRRWRDGLSDLCIEAFDHFHTTARRLGYGETADWLSTLAEGSCLAVQCDFAVMLSPEMFAQFAVPQLERITGWLDYSLYHLDGVAQMRFLDQLADIELLDGIQWNPEPKAGGPLDWLDAFREIRGRGLTLLVWAEPDDAAALTRELGPEGLMLVLPEFDTPDDAHAAIERIAHV